MEQDQQTGILAPQAPEPEPEPLETPPAEEHNAFPASVGQAVGLLAAGLLPGFGIPVCLWWAYAGRPGPKTTLAKAMLWLHGAGLCLALLLLCLWVLRLAGF